MATSAYQYITDRRWFERFLEILPGALTWLFLIAPIGLSFIKPLWVAYFIIAFDLYWLLKAFRLSIFLVRGYSQLHRTQRINWAHRLDWLEDPKPHLAKVERRMRDLVSAYPSVKRRLQFSASGLKAHQKYLGIANEIDTLRDIEQHEAAIIKPSELYHLVIIATYNESYEILRSSIEALLQSEYRRDRLMVVIAYEERGGQATKETAESLVAEFGPKFRHAQAIMHPDGIVGELQGKGANLTFAGRQMAKIIGGDGMNPENIIVTTLDSDHRVDKQYFSRLSYVYATNPNRLHKSYQPVPMFYNNIWDAPAPMRVIATNNSFWVLIEAMRPHRLRNFAAHAQSFKALLDTDFWSVTSPVEDGHQYWRSWFAFDGDHEVLPLYIPVYQDAVLDKTYLKTFVAQYKQMRRWAFGVSDFPYVVRHAIRNKHIPFLEKVIQIFRLFEGHFSWATAALVVSFVAWLPLFLNPHFARQELAHQLPIIASRLMNVATIGLVITVAVSMISLPPRPPHHGRTRSLGMLIQWALLPVVAILFGSFAAIDSQTRLMLGKHLGFYVTPKARRE